MALACLLSAPRAAAVSLASPAPVAPWVADFDTGDWSQFEIGTSPDRTTYIGNWPYGELIDAGREGAPGGPRINLVDRSSDPTHVRLGDHAVKISLHQGDASYLGLDQNGTVDATWLQYGDSEDRYWCNGTATPGGQVCSPPTRLSNYRPGESRAALLPPDADVIGREAYWGMSMYFDPNTTYGSTYYVGPNWHGGNPCNGESYTGLALNNDRMSFTVRGSNTSRAM